jgi:hypothetical protein
MNPNLQTFIRRFPDFAGFSHLDKITRIGYFLQELGGSKALDAKLLSRAYESLDLPKPKNFADLLSKLESNGTLVKANGGYRLSMKVSESISHELGNPVLVALPAELMKLPSMLKGSERDFLQEATNCVSVKAWRAAIVLSWILTMDHLEEYVLQTDLASFNQAISKNAKYTGIRVIRKEDFEDIKESDFITALRSAGLITNDQRKILDEKLGVRNSCAHPSGLVITENKVASFLEDLVLNIVTKLPIS